MEIEEELKRLNEKAKKGLTSDELKRLNELGNKFLDLFDEKGITKQLKHRTERFK